MECFRGKAHARYRRAEQEKREEKSAYHSAAPATKQHTSVLTCCFPGKADPSGRSAVLYMHTLDGKCFLQDPQLKRHPKKMAEKQKKTPRVVWRDERRHRHLSCSAVHAKAPGCGRRINIFHYNTNEQQIRAVLR